MEITLTHLVVCVWAFTLYNVYLVHSLKAMCNDSKRMLELFCFPDKFPEKRISNAIRRMNMVVCELWVLIKLMAGFMEIPPTMRNTFWMVFIVMTILSFSIYVTSYLGSVNTYEIMKECRETALKKYKEDPFHVSGEIGLLQTYMRRFDTYMTLHYIACCLFFFFLSAAMWTFHLIH